MTSLRRTEWLRRYKEWVLCGWTIIQLRGWVSESEVWVSCRPTNTSSKADSQQSFFMVQAIVYKSFDEKQPIFCVIGFKM